MTQQFSPGCLSQRNSHQVHEEIARYSIVCGGQVLEMNSVSLTRRAEVKCDGALPGLLCSSCTHPSHYERASCMNIEITMLREKSNKDCGTQHNITQKSKYTKQQHKIYRNTDMQKYIHEKYWNVCLCEHDRRMSVRHEEKGINF